MSETFAGTYEDILESLEEFDEDDTISMTVAQARTLVKAAIFVKQLKDTPTYN